jgi:hypothetical protein
LASLEERVARLERAYKRSRIITALKVLLYLFLITGVLLYFAGLYQSRGEWKAEVSRAPSGSYEPPYTLNINIPLSIYDPDGTVTAKLIYYKLYIEGYPAGDGLIPYLKLKHGWNNITISAKIDLSRTTCGLAKALHEKNNVTIRVAGYAMIDLRVLGRFTWKTVTVPFNFTAREVSVPEIGEPAATFLGVYSYYCDHPGILAELPGLLNLSGLSNLTGDQLPGASGSNNTLDLNIYYTYKLEGAGYNLTLIIENNMNDTINIYNIEINGENVMNQTLMLKPGDRVTLHAKVYSIVSLLRITTDRGEITKIITLGG